MKLKSIKHNGFHQRSNICCLNAQDHIFYDITAHDMGGGVRGYMH